MDYNTKFDKELYEAEKVAGALSETWKAHLYLKKMRLKPEQQTLLLTASLGVYTYEAFSRAALSTFPTVQGLRREKGGHDDRHTGGGRGWFSRKGKPGRKSHDKKGGKQRRGFSHRAHECHDSENTASDGLSEEEDAESARSDSPSEGDNDPDDEDVPDELREAGKEAEAYVTQAKKQRAEVEKARGFFKRGASGSDQY